MCRCRHKLASMPRWLSSAKVRMQSVYQCPQTALTLTCTFQVEVVRKLLAGAPAFVSRCLVPFRPLRLCACAEDPAMLCATCRNQTTVVLL